MSNPTIKIGDVSITLTNEQLAEIDKQRLVKSLKREDILGLKEAEEVLKHCKEHEAMVETDYKRKKDWFAYKLETIIKAVNFIDNGFKLFKPKFDGVEYFFTPYFNLKNDSFSYGGYYSWSTGSNVGFGWGFKSKEAMLQVIKNNLQEYKDYITTI